VRVAPLIHGGGQEQGMRSGTLAVHQIAGMGEAFALAKECMLDEQTRLYDLRNRFLKGINQSNVIINGALDHSYPGIINLCFSGIPAKTLENRLPEIAFSVGSACHSKGIEPSYVLRALGLSKELAECSARFSFGRFTTLNEIDFAIKRFCSVITT
jgi:cysteine desulfurase